MSFPASTGTADAGVLARHSVHRQFEAQALSTPDVVAVVCRHEQMTYAELNGRANQLARHLATLHMPPETIVGICLDRSLEMVVALLAVLKAGCAYLPLDPGYPRDRLRLMIEDSSAGLLITHGRSDWALPDHQVATVGLDTDRARYAAHDRGNLNVAVAAEHLAYVIYTSGSTGRPKGVMVEHRNVTSFFAGMDASVGGAAPGVWLAVTSLSFDISVLELLWTLARGYTVVVHHATKEVSDGARAAAEYSVGAEMMRHGVTHLQCTPSMAGMLLLQDDARRALGGVTTMLLGGEVLPAPLARELCAVVGGRVFNMYGPTETTIWSSTQRVGDVAGGVPIGMPIDGTVFHVLDAERHALAAGESGELYISGAGVGRGYLHRPQLTDERFVEVAGVAGGAVRAYRTGDMVRCRPDGVFEFVGRCDDQVKIRGHRIEPGEIEAVLCELPQVREAAVVAREVSGDLRLVAYCVMNGGDQAATADVRMALRKKLPAHMVPSHVVSLVSLPLTPNGKIDRKALPALDQVKPLAREAGVGGTGLEYDIARIWKRVLQVPQVGGRDNFFDLGGHALLAVEVQQRLQAALHRAIPLVDLLRYPTVQTLAGHLQHSSAAGTGAEVGVESERRGATRRTSMNQFRKMRGQV